MPTNSIEQNYNDFKSAISQYNSGLNLQLKQLATAFRDRGWETSQCHGVSNYRSRGTLEGAPYPLHTSAKWLVAKKNIAGKKMFAYISAGVLEVDDVTDNIHFLGLRVGADVTEASSNEYNNHYQQSLRERYEVDYEFEKPCRQALDTGINFPLSEIEIEKVIRLCEDKARAIACE